MHGECIDSWRTQRFGLKGYFVWKEIMIGIPRRFQLPVAPCNQTDRHATCLYQVTDTRGLAYHGHYIYDLCLTRHEMGGAAILRSLSHLLFSFHDICFSKHLVTFHRHLVTNCCIVYIEFITPKVAACTRNMSATISAMSRQLKLWRVIG